jgi:signal transduction histidine kinase
VDVSLSVSPIRGPGGAIIGAAKIARDITEAKQLRDAERQLTAELEEQAVELEQQATELEQQIDEAQALQEELEQTNQELTRALDAAQSAQQVADTANHAKSQFLATMSHELRTPLNAIAGYVDLIASGIRGPISDEARQDLARVKRSQEALLRLIEDLLDLAKLEAGRIEYTIERVAVDEVLHSLEGFVGPKLHSKPVDYELHECGLFVRADRDKLQQILINLLSNAVKFTDRGRISVECAPDGDRVRFKVSDTGRGIPRELHERIFEAFEQGNAEPARRADGTGLGLAIARQLARGMEGDIRVESEPDKGSTFTLLLPAAQDSAKPVPEFMMPGDHERSSS